MYQLTRKQAQRIVDKMMHDIPYNINIMDKNGVIIGSGHKKRIGTLHQGAVEAIKQKKVVDIEHDEEFVKKGTNLPIEINGDIIGVVGISGEVEETRPFGELVRSTVILLIEQSAALERKNREEQLKQIFFNRIINPDTPYTPELIEQAEVYDIQLLKPSQIIYVEAPEWIEDKKILRVPCFKTSNNTLCLVVQDTKNIQSIINELQKENPTSFLSISQINEKIATGYIQARSALRVLKGLSLERKIIFYHECDFIADLSELLIDNPKLDRLLTILEKNEDLMKTIQVYIKTNLNLNEAANALNIHRNTLNYRLDRIEKLTGKNPKKIIGLLELFLMLIYRI